MEVDIKKPATLNEIKVDTLMAADGGATRNPGKVY
jgi:hypothetical protein